MGPRLQAKALRQSHYRIGSAKVATMFFLPRSRAHHTILCAWQLGKYFSIHHMLSPIAPPCCYFSLTEHNTLNALLRHCPVVPSWCPTDPLSARTYTTLQKSVTSFRSLRMLEFAL